MRRRKREMWKTGIAIAGLLLLLVHMVWVPVSAAGAHEGTSELATPVTGTVQATPTVDPTMTTLEKEKLAQEIDQLKNQNYWSWTTIGPILVGFAGLLAALYSFITCIRNRQDEQKKRDEEQKRWLDDRQAERERRAEERFQSTVEGLGSEREEARVGAAILLRTFLRPGYEQFYIQTYDLAVAHLRLPRTTAPLKDPHNLSHVTEDPNTPLPLTTLSQALSVAFKEAFPLARNITPGAKETQRAIQSLDASDVQLDCAYLVGADLKQIMLWRAFLREASLWRANLSRADLCTTVALSWRNTTLKPVWEQNWFEGSARRGVGLKRGGHLFQASDGHMRGLAQSVGVGLPVDASIGHPTGSPLGA
jgi:hypothetical protein